MTQTAEQMLEPTRDRAIIRFLNSKPWAITREALETIQDVVVNHLDGVEVRLAKADRTAKAVGHVSHPDVAVIPIHGTVAKRLYGLDAISGGATTQDWQQQIQDALDNNAIKAIVLDVDSPGGTVDGTKELADFIMNAREQKPIVAYANGQMASAAYWIGSAASHIVAFDTAQVGSIGVIISHRDYTEREKMLGVKTTHIYAGKYKTVGTPYEPLSKESKDILQESVDYYYTMFVNAVAEQRGVDVDTVLKQMAEGRVFIGAQSKEAGLVDLIGNLEDAIILAKQGGNTVTIQEAVKEFGAQNLLAHLVTTHGAELPQSVIDAYTASTKPVLELPEEVREMIEGLQLQVDALKQEKESAEAALKKEQEEAARKEHEEAVVKLLTPLGLGEDAEFVAIGMSMEIENFTKITTHMATLKSQIKEVSEELFTETDGATSQSTKEEDQPTSFDGAVTFIEKRDNIQTEAAISVAAKEFPELYQKHIQGGNE